MSITINCNIEKSLEKDEIVININASQNSEELQNIVNNIHKVVSKEKDSIIGYNKNELYILPIENIIVFYAQDQKCYCKTSDGDYLIKKRLYELEETLNENQFIRISNSYIVNVKYIKSFDLNYIGNIQVKMKNGEMLSVSKRRTSKILKFLKERWN